jgi:TetR/AcrR family transcriptional repressor of nem operon
MGRVSGSKEKLVEAALAVVLENCYSAVTVDMICRRARLLPGSFYHFFKSKAEAVAIALRHHWAKLKVEMDRIFDPAVPPLDRMRGYFEFVYQRAENTKLRTGRVLGCVMTNVGTELGPRDQIVRQTVMEVLAEHREYFEKAVRDACEEGIVHVTNVPAKVRAILTYYSGAITAARLYNDPTLIRAVADHAVRFLAYEPESADLAYADTAGTSATVCDEPAIASMPG